MHDREGSRARGDWCSLHRTSALALQWRMGKREKAVALQCSCTCASPRVQVQLLLVRTGRFLGQTLGRQSGVGWPEDPDLFFLSQSPTSPSITQWSLLEGTSGDYLVQHPAKAGCARAGCTKSCAGGAAMFPEPLWAACASDVSWSAVQGSLCWWGAVPGLAATSRHCKGAGR